MKLQLYGSHLCKDTIHAISVLSGAGADYDFIDISGSMRDLKAFLRIRDGHPELFNAVRAADQVGIPCFVKPDGSITLELSQVL
ncbi:MAG: glutaredoxin [Clostridiales bacterium]|nr:glutaredoxin [Clostridiales bacterium]